MLKRFSLAIKLVLTGKVYGINIFHIEGIERDVVKNCECVISFLEKKQEQSSDCDKLETQEKLIRPLNNILRNFKSSLKK